MTDSRPKRAGDFLKRYRWRLIWAAGLLLSVGWTLRLLLGLPSVVTPSKETTYLTGRTLPDGSLDFSAALASHCNMPIDDDNNVAMGFRTLPDPHPTLPFLNQYAVEQTTNPEQAFEVFTVLAEEQGMIYGKHLLFSNQQGVLTAWTREQYPAVAALVDMNGDYVRQWKVAVRRPSMVKPVGTTLDEIYRDIHRGASYTLIQGMMHAGEGEWDRAIDDFSAIDTAINHLCRLQCGWKLQQGLRLRRDISLSLTKMLRDLAGRGLEEPLNSTFVDYIRRRSKWPLQEVLYEAIDNHIRIKAQTDIREARNPKKGQLERLLGSGLLSNREARSVQVTQLRNSIDWDAAARIQNEAIDDYLESIQTDGLVKLGSNLSAVRRKHIVTHPSRELFGPLRELSAADITVPFAWFVTNRFTSDRMMFTTNFALAAHHADQASLFFMALMEFRDQHQRWPTSTTELPDSSEALNPRTGETFIYEGISINRVPEFPEMGGWSRQLRLPQ